MAKTNLGYLYIFNVYILMREKYRKIPDQRIGFWGIVGSAIIGALLGVDRRRPDRKAAKGGK